MERRAVQSENLASVGYEDGTSTLEIEFISGMVYQYFDVPSSVARELFELADAGASVGEYFQGEIRGRYRYARV